MAEESAAMSAQYRTVHVPDDPVPPHHCRPPNYAGGTKPEYKDRTIIECNDCGIFWWATVFSFGKGNYLDPTNYHLHWAKVRWYHFRLRKYVR